MTWIKICGITNLEDARTAVDASADALGFVFYEKSPRYVTPEAAGAIISELPEEIEKVGVFVGDSRTDPVDIFLSAGLTGIQNTMLLSSPNSQGGAVARGLVAHAGLTISPKMYWSFPVSEVLEEPDAIKGLAASFSRLLNDTSARDRSVNEFFGTFFLDSGSLRQPGGTGKTFDWQKAVPIAEGMREGSLKLVVAGGLTPDNVGEAMRILKPWGVDVSSGVEVRPGKKDPEKVRAFIAAVRAADKAV